MSQTEHQFKIGTRVQVKTATPEHNPRVPPYIKGKAGVIKILHGESDNPLDHRGHYGPLYTVAFVVRDVFGGTSRDILTVDLHEDCLDPT